jgi:pimeloyl-ACP methyl ester carboxylesterase
VNVDRELGALEMPLLYLRGRFDRLVPAREAMRLCRVQPAMQVATLDAPHLLLQRKPAEAAERIAAHLATVGNTS